jgi:hypothetical protein
MLLASLLATLGALLGVLDGGVGRRLPTLAQGWVKLGRLVAGGVLGGDAAHLLGSVPIGVGRCLEGLY